MKWILVLAGAVLFLAPFISGFSSQPVLLWFCLIGGLATAVLGFFKAYRWAAILGLVIFVLPWIFGFTGTSAAVWAWITGAVVILLAGYKGFIADNKASSENIQRV